MKKNDKDERLLTAMKREMRTMMPASSIGLVFVISIVIGALIGVWLDGKLGTKPWLTIFFIIIGVASGVKNAYMFYKKAEKLMKEQENKPQ